VGLYSGLKNGTALLALWQVIVRCPPTIDSMSEFKEERAFLSRTGKAHEPLVSSQST
jgi:hypothetical protein